MPLQIPPVQVSVVTALFNRLDLTRAYLASLERTLADWCYEVILIDDGSTDGTREFLATLSPERYRVVLNDPNRGFSANNNAGARLAAAPLLCLLNNDTVLLPGWLEPMARLASLLPDAALVGNVQREPVSGLIDHYGVFFDHDGQPIHAGKNAAVAPREDYLRWPAVTAACCVVRRKVFLELDGFDEGYRNGLEDVDFCLRAHVRGYRHFVANRSVIYHHISASPGRKAGELENFRRFRERWGVRPMHELGGPQKLAAQRDARRYLRKHRWQPWRYNFWRLTRALEQVWGPPPSERGLERLPRAVFRWQDWRRSRRADFGTTDARPERAPGPAPIFLVVGDTVRHPAHTGVATVVRSLAGAFGRIGAPVRLAHWEADSRCLRLLPPECAVGLDAEELRETPEALAGSNYGPSLFAPTAARWDDPFTRTPPLHDLPAPPPPGAWIILPEVPPLDRAAQLLAYAHRHGWRMAVVFHDALATNEPHLFPPDASNSLEFFIRSISGSDLILPVSDFSALDLRRFAETKFLQLPPTVVCRPGADTFTRVRTLSTPLRREQPGNPVRILCVSAVAPRKNHRVLLAAYDLVAAARPDLNVELCCIGENRPSHENIAAGLHEAMARYPGKVTWYERVDYSTLQRLYEECDFTVYPSGLEGFGLPILESLWFRRPCLCAPVGATAETARGGGCVTPDMRDPQALADAILALAGSSRWLPPLADEIDARALRTWEEYARDVLAVLTTVAP